MLNVIATIIIFIIAVVVLVAVIFKDEIKNTKEKDPAARGYIQIIFIYSGLHAIIIYRITHILWKAKLRFLARWQGDGDLDEP